jgi:hypothetical protein
VLLTYFIETVYTDNKSECVQESKFIPFFIDIENKDYILHCGGVRIVAACLSSHDEDTVLSAISTLMFLVTPQSKPGNRLLFLSSVKYKVETFAYVVHLHVQSLS